jgi:hypothetical protein
VADVVQVLTDSVDTRQYIKRMRQRDPELDSYWGTICTPLLELIFTMLGEKVTTEISQTEKPDTFEKNKKVAKRGGSVAGTARRETEKELGRSIVSKKNFLPKKLKGA